MAIKVTLDWLREVAGPPDITGITPLVRETVPLNPPMLVRSTRTSPVEPCETLRKEGCVVNVKSGGDGNIVTDNLAVRIIDPLCPVKIIEYVPGTALLSALRNRPPVKVAPEPNGGGVSIPTPTPAGMLEGVMVTLPLNPFRL